MIRALIARLDERLGAAPFLRKALRRAFPDHWSFMLGEIAVYAFLVLLATGTWITSQYDASDTLEVYQGPFTELNGHWLSSAYSSTLRLSSVIPLGLLVRQAHHWAALIFLGAIVTHMARVFFTGAFRKPRELNWLVGLALLVLAMAEGFIGYSLPDDLHSGTRLRIVYSILLSLPVLGQWLAFHLFGGAYPNGFIIGHLFIVHVWVIPGILIGAVAVHLAMVWRQKHTQFPGPRRTESNVLGPPLWPHHLFKSVGVGAGVFGISMLLGGLVSIDPVWLYGPYEPWKPSPPMQPDWYFGWLDGALRLGPSWEPHLGRFVIPSLFFSGFLLPAGLIALLAAWPLIERRFTRDARHHELLELPQEVPWRTAFGAAFIGFVLVLLLAGSSDIEAAFFHISVERLTDLYRVMLPVVPLAFGAITYYVCREMRLL
jgi:ubiquinol-cytochrome c reductase cytochrome b subunit